MSSVEAAASLFGLEGDAGPDPFAVIGNEDADTTQATGSNIEQQLAEHAQYDTSSCLANMGQDASSLFAEQMYPDAQASGHDAWSLSPEPRLQRTGAMGPMDPTSSSKVGIQMSIRQVTNRGPLILLNQLYGAPSRATTDPYRPSPEGHRQPSSAPSYAQAQPPMTLTSQVPLLHIRIRRQLVSGAQITRESYKPISRSYLRLTLLHLSHPRWLCPPQPVADGNTPPAATTAASVAKRAVSARTPRSASPATGHQTHGQTAAPPVPPLPPTVTMREMVHHLLLWDLPPRPASQQQVVDLHRRAENYSPMPYQNGITYVPPSVKESGPLPREPPVSRQVPPVRPTAVSNKYTPDPSQDTYSDNVIEDSLRHVSNDSLSCNTLETNGVSQDHDVFGEQLESQTVYTSDDMPWRDPEDGGFESGFPQSGAVSSSTWPAASAKYGSSSASDYSPHQPAKSLLDVSSREPGLVPAGSSADDFTQNAGGIHVASHLGRLPHRQGSSLNNGRASPGTYSAHARTASSGSSISSLRSPILMVPDPNTPAHVARAVHPYDPSPYASVQRASSQASMRPTGPHLSLDEQRHRVLFVLSLQSWIPTLPLEQTQPMPYPSFVEGSRWRNELGPACQPYSGEPNSFGSVPAYAINPEAHMTVSRPAYAPSPSLLGSNDPLGRVSARAPIVSFGFGGKLVTCFHGSADLSTGFDVALSSRRTTNIAIREVHQVLPEYALEPQAALYPGPLFSDPGSPVTSLVRTGMSSNLKTKKARVIKYLEERAVEMSRGATYASEGFERRKVEDKLALVQVLKAMVEYDGVLHGSPQIDSAIRAALVPYIGDNINEAGKESSASLSTSTFTPPFADGYSTSLPTTNETLISVTATRPSALDKIQEFLVRGERRQAYHYALDEKLWAHAMVISSSIDKEAWKEVVGEFLKAELGVHDPQHALVTRGNDSVPPRTNGRECLRVVYSLFSGQGPAAIQELVPINLLSRAPASLKVPAPHLPHVTPMSPNFPSAAAAAQVPSESLLKWSAAITALGDYLLSHQQAEAAHVCYMLSPQTSIIGGVGSPSARIILLGSQSPHSKPTFCKDFDATIFSEILEFAFSLKATPKGQESFLGFPHLQAYKLIRAVYLAEIGHVLRSNHCFHESSLTYFNPVMIGQLRSLAERLIGAPDVDKSGSWISGKVNKPSLDSIGSWLEGRLTKFIAGEGDESFPSATSAPSTFSGPAPYSSMSSAATSTSSSPPPMMPNGQFAPAQPPRRTGSAMSLPSTQSYAPIDRASSAMEHHRPAHSASPAPPKTAPLQPFYPFSPYTPPMNGHATTTSGSSLPPQEQARQESGGWWNSLSNADSSTTPVATTFVKVDALSATPSSGAVPRRLDTTFEDEEDDLGLSNSAFKKPEECAKPVKGDSPSPTPPQEPAVPTEDKSGSSPTTQAAVSEAPGPVKANLGEETSFYYDKELKRWVNKKAGAEGAQPVAPTPPPPVRAQTASPSQARRPTTGGPPIALPLARTASAIDLTSPKPSMRPRSNLVPPEVACHSHYSNLDLGAGIAPPPMGRPRSQAAKKNVRSRYVDVFQQEAGASAA
ncbi:Sec23-binding domain of Sec16-domain-containing protein [Pisolithus thermaeus]|nr:Sec23-binding domain of Sec16-domain-containing protein [Pisolithus thermaeus]